MDKTLRKPVGETMTRWLATIAGVPACIVQLGCAPADPTGELRALVEAAEAAAERRDTGFFRDLVGESYVDGRGRRRDDIIALIRGYFFVNAEVGILSRIEDIVVVGDDVAELTLLTAIVGRGQSELTLDFDADAYRIELELVKNSGEWRVIGADWRRMLP